MKVQVSHSGKRYELELGDNPTLGHLKKVFHKKFPKYYPERQRFSRQTEEKPVALTNDKEHLTTLDVKEGDILRFKDLGPQIGYQTVFLIEYFGPILFHALCYYCPETFYGPNNLLHSIFPSLFYGGAIPAKTSTQTLIFYLVVLHFLKREFETLFVHKFSHATMPIFNLFKNCSHYWISGGILLAYISYHPLHPGTQNSTLVYLSIALWIYGELSNLSTHIILSNLRPKGSTERKIPNGYGFIWVSCPNYFFEIVGWIAITMLSPNWISIFFLLSGAGQMALWAIKKHKQYKKDFPSYPRSRKVMIPFIF